MIQHLTHLVGRRAWITATGTRVSTTSQDASQITGAFVVHSAFNRVRSARHFASFVQHETVFTDADGPVSSDFAAFALIAGYVLEVARILTSAQVGVTSVIGRALVVPGTHGYDRCT